MSVVSLADLKTFANIPTGTQDAELQDMLDRAEAILAQRVGPLAPVVITEERHAGPGPILLRHRPVISVDAVTNDGVAVADTDLNAESGVLYADYGAFGYGFSRSVKVTYTAGRAALPLDLEAAVLELTKHLWASQRPAGAQAPPGSLQDDDVRPGSSYLLPYRVQALIEPYMLPAIA